MKLANDQTDTRDASQIKLAERESWHKLVVKIIIWKDDSVSSLKTSMRDKLTLIEWSTYHKHMVETNLTQNKDKVLADLKETLQKIKLNGGLEE